MKDFKVLVNGAKALTGNKDELVYEWSEQETPWNAINFANGLVEGLEWVNGLTANKPMVQQIDGYWWQFEKGQYAGMTIKVVDENGEIVDQKTEGFNN